MFENLTTGILYRNPKPHVKSIHAYFPSVVVMPRGQMVAIYALGEAFEATNLHTYLARSSDGGQTWEQVNIGLTNTDIKSLTVTSAEPVTVYVGTADGKLFAYMEE